MDKNDVDFFLKKGFIGDAIVVVSFLDEPGRSEVTEVIFDECVKNGWLGSTRRVALLISRELSREDVETVLGNAARKMVELFDRKLTRKELKVILNEFERELIQEDIKAILIKCNKEGRTEDAWRVASLFSSLYHLEY